ncbi:MAG: hypothetical protein LBG95_01860 [Treponema sp.]|jgi:hypothetical protein|nr:hypothetical protein [Treponema sp.]
MFNFKWSLVSGGAALVLAFVTSLLLGHASLPVALTRAGIFAALFFGLGSGVFALINNFIPELLSGSYENATDHIFSTDSTGSRVNITLDDNTSNAALPDTNNSSANADEVGDFNDLVSGAFQARKDIDQSSSSGYTGNEDKGDFLPVFDDINDLGDFSMDFGAFVSDEGGAASAGSDMDSFSFFPGTDDSGETEEYSPPERKSSMNKSTELKGDFNPKEIAAGIRTVLEKDKKG